MNVGDMTRDASRGSRLLSPSVSLSLSQVSLLCLLICVFGLYALMRKKPRSSEEGGVEYTPAVGNRHFMVRIPWKITSVEGTDRHCRASERLFSCFPSPVGRPLPRSCQSIICRVCPSNICRFKCPLPSFPFFSAICGLSRQNQYYSSSK